MGVSLSVFRTAGFSWAATLKGLRSLSPGWRQRGNEEPLGGSAMQYAHWLMVAGAVLVVLAFIGLALHKNAAGTAEGHLTRDTASETVQAALESEGEMPPKRQRRPNGIF